MKKIILASLCTLSLLCAESTTSESQSYIGLDIGNTAATLTAKASPISISEDDDGGSQTLKAGRYLDNNSRLYGFFQNINVDDGTFRYAGFGYDYLIGEYDFKPFVGAILAYGNFTDDITEADLKGFLYGAQAGLNYTLTEDFSFDLGYRFLKSSMSDKIVYSDVNIDFSIDDISNWYVGVNYIF